MTEMKTYRRIATRAHPIFANEACWKEGYTFEGVDEGDRGIRENVGKSLPRWHVRDAVEIVE